MREVLVQREQAKAKSGRPPKLDLDDQLVLTLCLWRGSRTDHHRSLASNVDESTVRRTAQRVEDALIHSGPFRLPGKKALLAPNTELEAVIVDVTQASVERPEKNSAITTAATRRATPQRHRRWWTAPAKRSCAWPWARGGNTTSRSSNAPRSDRTRRPSAWGTAATRG